MQLRLLDPVLLLPSLLVVCIALTSFQSDKTNSGPLIEFTYIPPVVQGEREKVDMITRRVRTARPNQRIVTHAQDGPWSVQPQPPYLES